MRFLPVVALTGSCALVSDAFSTSRGIQLSSRGPLIPSASPSHRLSSPFRSKNRDASSSNLYMYDSGGVYYHQPNFDQLYTTPNGKSTATRKKARPSPANNHHDGPPSSAHETGPGTSQTIDAEIMTDVMPISGRSGRSRPEEESNSKPRSRKRDDQLQYDKELNRVVDYIAERILNHNEDFQSKHIKQILADEGFDVTSFGFAWGTTTFTNYDTLEELVATTHSDIIADDSYTHYALGFARGSDNVNAYMFLATAYNTCGPGDDICEAETHVEHGFAVLGMVNQARVNAGLKPLTLDTGAVQRAAQWHSDDMVTHGYPTQRMGGVAHIGSDGSTAADRVEREGYHALAVRENILSRYDYNAAGAFEQWWTSRTHKANMMADDITSMALAVSCDAETGQYFYTQVFARPFVEVEPSKLVAPLVNRLHDLRANQHRQLLRPDKILMQYATLLARYISENGEMPQSAWEKIAPYYPYQEITAVVAWTPYDDTDTTMEYLTKSYSPDLQNSAFSEMGVGIYRDSDKKLYYNVVILARPRQQQQQPRQEVEVPKRDPQIMHGPLEHRKIDDEAIDSREKNVNGHHHAYASTLRERLTPDRFVY